MGMQIPRMMPTVLDFYSGRVPTVPSATVSEASPTGIPARFPELIRSLRAFIYWAA